MGLKAYNVICTNDISENYDVDALGATDFEAYACDDVDEHIGKLDAVLAEKDAEIADAFSDRYREGVANEEDCRDAKRTEN